MEKTKREAEQELNRKLAEWAECFREDQLPDFTQSLDDCFKWLVPKVYSTIQVEDICFGKENGEDYCHILWWTGKPKTDSYGCGVYEGRSDNPVLALCLAIEKIINKETQ